MEFNSRQILSPEAYHSPWQGYSTAPVSTARCRSARELKKLGGAGLGSKVSEESRAAGHRAPDPRGEPGLL